MATDDRTVRIDQLQRLAELERQTHTFARLAELYRRSGERELALRVVRDGLKHHPYYLEARLLHARVLLELGREEPARAEFEHILTLDPENPLACMALGVERVATQADESGGAVSTEEWLEQIDEAWRGDDADVHPLRADRAARTVSAPWRGIETATLAELYTRQGLFDRAIGVYEQMLSCDPDNAEIVAALRELERRADEARGSSPAGSRAAPADPAERMVPADQAEGGAAMASGAAEEAAAPAGGDTALSIREQICRILDTEATQGSD